MISPTRIEYELLRCINIRYSLIILCLDATIYGYANRIYRSVKDIMTLYALEKALYNAVYYDFTDTEIENIIYKIREFLGMLSYVSKVDYFLTKYPGLDCGTDVTTPYTKPTDIPGSNENTIIVNNNNTVDNTEWHTTDLTPKITVDGQTVIPDIGFNISDIDIDTVLLQVQGDDSYYTVSGEGFHIVGTTLYWHSFYDLKVGMQIVIKWREE